MSDKMTLKDIYKEMFHCRDFELQHLWQRSVFLGAFLIAIGSSYGKFINEYFICIKNVEIENIVRIHLFGLSLTFIGLVFSILWIMMAKGSKYWYERYEDSINAFYESGVREHLFENDILTEIEGDKIPCANKLRTGNVSDCLIFTKGGKYSVSKINIFIGQFACLIWMICLSIHLSFVMQLMNYIPKEIMCFIFCFFISIIIVLWLKLLISKFFVHSKN